MVCSKRARVIYEHTTKRESSFKGPRCTTERCLLGFSLTMVKRSRIYSDLVICLFVECISNVVRFVTSLEGYQFIRSIVRMSLSMIKIRSRVDSFYSVSFQFHGTHPSVSITHRLGPNL